MMRDCKMKKIFIIHFFILIILFACSGAKESWDKTKSLNSITAYEEYLKEYPNSEYSNSAREQLELLYEQQDWENAKLKNSISEYEKFIILHPNSKLTDTAKENIQELKIAAEWETTLAQNSMIGYENFLSNYPNSKHTAIAQQKLITLMEKEAWAKTQQLDSIEGYDSFIRNNPDNPYVNIAKEKLFELREITPFWQATLARNTLQGYHEFISKYPNSKFVREAKRKIIEIDEKDWLSAINSGTIKSFTNYLNKHPDGKYSETAEAKIIDIEVNNIFKGNPGKLPPATKSKTYTDRNYTVYSVYNDTKYNLVLRYTGTETFKVTFKSQEKAAIELKNGNYRVTASVDASNVRDYAGEENVDGSDYFVAYYIISKPGDSGPAEWKYGDKTEHYPIKRWIKR